MADGEARARQRALRQIGSGGVRAAAKNSMPKAMPTPDSDRQIRSKQAAVTSSVKLDRTGQPI
jgi:hypothetical protein